MYTFTDHEWELVTYCIHDGTKLLPGNHKEKMGITLEEIHTLVQSQQREFTNYELGDITEAYFGALQQLCRYKATQNPSNNCTWDEAIKELRKLINHFDEPSDDPRDQIPAHLDPRNIAGPQEP